MPIKGLTDETSIGSGLPIIARLYKGEEKPEGGNRPGKDLDYFRVEFEPQFEYLRKDWEALYGEHPREFPRAYFAAPTVDEAFQAWKEEWTATVLLHRCDGESQVQWWDANAGAYFRSKKPCAAPQCGCKATGRLNLILPDFLEVTGILGYIALTTHSVNDILTLYRYLNDIQRMYGQLNGVPFVFGRAKRVISVPKKDKNANGRGDRMRTSKSLLYIHVTGDFALNRLLPAMASAAPITPALSESAIDAETGRKLLGQGNGARRIGGETPNGGAKADTNTWLENAETRKVLLEWAVKWGLDAGGVLVAFENAVDYEVNALEDWHESKDAAAAAIIAAACDYDPAEIERRTSTSNVSIETYHAALDVAERVNALMVQDGAAEEDEAEA